MRKIPGFNKQYAASVEGHIWSYPKKWRNLSHKGKWIKESFSGGYLGLSLNFNKVGRRYLVHRLVALTYLKNSKNLRQVNHKNGIKTDNRVENLEWCSPSENQRHASDNGLMRKGVKHHNAKLNPKSVKDIRKNIKRGTTHGINFFANKYSVNKKTIANVIQQRIWKDV